MDKIKTTEERNKAEQAEHQGQITHECRLAIWETIEMYNLLAETFSLYYDKMSKDPQNCFNKMATIISSLKKDLYLNKYEESDCFNFVKILRISKKELRELNNQFDEDNFSDFVRSYLEQIEEQS